MKRVLVFLLLVTLLPSCGSDAWAKSIDELHTLIQQGPVIDKDECATAYGEFFGTSLNVPFSFFCLNILAAQVMKHYDQKVTETVIKEKQYRVLKGTYQDTGVNMEGGYMYPEVQAEAYYMQIKWQKKVYTFYLANSLVFYKDPTSEMRVWAEEILTNLEEKSKSAANCTCTCSPTPCTCQCI